MCVKLGFAS